MISKIKEALADTIVQAYPKANVYDEFVAQRLSKGGFFIEVIEQDFERSLHKANKSRLGIDLAYFPFAKKESLRNEIEEVKQTLFRLLDRVGPFRVLAKSATVVDDVLHIRMTFNYKEVKVEEEAKMQLMHQNTEMKED